MRLSIIFICLFFFSVFFTVQTNAGKTDWYSENRLLAKSDTIYPIQNIAEYEIKKGNVPKVEFKLNDPCAPENQDKRGLPWEANVNETIELPDGINPAIPDVLPDYAELSKFSYNAAVSVAFEGMRLIYGHMPQEEYQKFEAIWQPLFDFPSQDIINYLNKLNPLIAEFLGAREAYMHRLSAMQIIYLDAALAVEDDDREAWDQVMSEGTVQANMMAALENSMKMLASKISDLGNPPNPMEAKCEAAKRYKRMFPEKGKGTIGECWSGFKKSNVQNTSLDVLYEPLFRHVAKVNGKFQIIEFIEDGHIENIESDEELLSHIRVKQVNEIYSPTAGMEEADGTFAKFTYPMIKRFPNTGYMKMMMLMEQSDVGKDHENYEEMQYFSNTCKRYLSRMGMAGFFYKHAMLWSYFNKWDNHELDQNGLISEEALADLEDDIRTELLEYQEAEKLKGKARRARKKEIEQKYDVTTQQESDGGISEKDSIALAEKSRQESVASYRENIESIDSQIDRERSIIDDLRGRIYKTNSPAEIKSLNRQIDDCQNRIMGYESTRTSYQDNIKYLETGDNTRTRQVFDDYARSKFIKDMKVEASEKDHTMRIYEGTFRQLKLLSFAKRQKVREYILKALDPETLASGDIEKALKVRNTINEMILGEAGQEHAQAQLEIAYSEENEFIAKSVIAVAGAATIGLGTAGLTSAYGAEATATIYGGKALGAVYGGVTGMIYGGPEEAVKQSLNFWGPYTGAAVSFYDGYQTAAKNPQLSTKDRFYEGSKQVLLETLVNGAIHLGAKGITKVALVTSGPNSRLFKPIAKTASQRSKEVLATIRNVQNSEHAKDAMKAFDNMNVELKKLKLNPKTNASKITKLQGELSQLSASMNADYDAKWLFKYKANPTSRMNFDKMVQRNYKKMTPPMIKRLEAQGYNMSDIEFKQYRNASSGGTSSMDLDLGPVSKSTGKEPARILKNGKAVDIEVFMNDAQKSMNAEYFNLFGINAKMSDMNLVTSKHEEAYATLKLLDKDVDFNNLTAEEVASVGKVIEVKMKNIENNKIMSSVNKLQAKCRESYKEVDNMLLKKLSADLKTQTPGTFEYKQTQEKINYWTDMNNRFKRIGTEEVDPMKIMQAEKEIYMETGGKTINDVINDLMINFGHNPLTK